MARRILCPKCKLRKWQTIEDHKNFRLKLLRCNNCGFEVDARIVTRLRHFSKIDSGDKEATSDTSDVAS